MTSITRSSDRRKAPEMPQLCVLIADDDPLVRRVLRDALQFAGMVVVAEAGDGQEALALTLQYRPDVVLMDVLMPGLDGIQATREIVKAIPDQAVITLTGAEDDDIGMLALSSGASGHLTKDVDIESLPRAILAVTDGQAAVSRTLTLRVIRRLRASFIPQDKPSDSGRAVLTVREWEVIDLLDQGRTTSEIASTLKVTSETVRSHVKNILQKLKVHSRTEAVLAARRLRVGE